MKTAIASRERGQFNLIDLLMMIGAVAAVMTTWYFYTESQRTCCSRQAQKITCLNNLKQLGLSYRIWGGDHGEKFPSQVSTNDGGTMELVASGYAFPDFVAMSNELGTAKIVVCPDDKGRNFAADFGALKSDTNVSYFTVPEADERLAEMWLSGDRNLMTNSVALRPGLFVVPTNRLMGWTAKIHKYKGNLALADGSVQQLTDGQLRQSFTNALRTYRATTTNSAFRLMIP